MGSDDKPDDSKKADDNPSAKISEIPPRIPVSGPMMRLERHHEYSDRSVILIPSTDDDSSDED